MNDAFATAMGRALQHTRAGDLMEATRLIQQSLNGQSSTDSPHQEQAPHKQPSSRRPLGQVIGPLVNGRTRRGGLKPGRTAKPTIPAGARYERRHHKRAHGGRTYQLFVPSVRERSPEGLIVMLHGCTQTADDFAAGTQMNLLAETRNLVVVYPDQTRQANQMGCWNWFRREDQLRDAGEPAILAGMAQDVAREFGIAEGRIFAAGLSAGGAMAAILGETYPDIFAAVGVHSGLAPGSAHNVASAFGAMRTPPSMGQPGSTAPVRSIVFHGTADDTVAPGNADNVITATLGSSVHSEIEDPSAIGATVTLYQGQTGNILAEKWAIPGMGHAWSGGASEGSYTHPGGPDASAEMIRFFLSGSLPVSS